MFHNGKSAKGFYTPPQKKIDPIPSFVNGNFETGDLTGWTVLNDIHDINNLPAAALGDVTVRQNVGIGGFSGVQLNNKGASIYISTTDGFRNSTLGIWQNVNLTGATLLNLKYCFAFGSEEDYTALGWRIKVDNTVLHYSETIEFDTLHNLAINIASYSGVHKISFEIVGEYMQHYGDLILAIDDIYLS